MTGAWRGRAAALALWLLAAGAASATDGPALSALIVDGQNNHEAWPKTTMMIKRYLEDTGRFRVDVARTKYLWQGKSWLEQYPLADGIERVALPMPEADPDFRPNFAAYDVVISNFGFGAAPWPEATRRDFEQYVAGGGGFVAIHAANNAFPDWPEYNRMIGLGGWGGRNEQAGPYVYLNQAEQLVRDASPGNGGSHGEQHAFPIVIRNDDHPITRGLPRVWMHAQDELYDRLRGPAANMTILATAFASPERGGTGRHEPMLLAIDYGQGRVFHTPMGHADYSMECVGFIAVLVRGAEWAATGSVAENSLPVDFPEAEKVSQRPFP